MRILLGFKVMNMEEELMDLKILDYIEVPSTFPLSADEIMSSIEDHYSQQCEAFLREESKFYACSKAVEQKLSGALQGASDLNNRLEVSYEALNRLAKDVDKLNRAEELSRRKEKLLGCLCDLVKMEKMRELLISGKIEDEDRHMKLLGDLDRTVVELKQMDSDARIVSQVKEELVGLLEEAVEKLVKDNLTLSMTEKIIGGSFEPFLRNLKVAAAFKQNLNSNRLNYFRIALNPLINNISYANNVVQLFQKITGQWSSLLQAEMELFFRQDVSEEVRGIVKETQVALLAEVLPKMERNIYKVKELVDMATIRYGLTKLLQRLNQISKGEWDPLLKVLVKLQILIEESLDTAGEQLEIAKYNIYSLVSYVPVRELLEKIKQCKAFEVEGSMLQWERPFKKLADSREPSKSPRNKSLIIFNLNIWYLYKYIFKEGRMMDRAESVLDWCKDAFATLNLQAFKEYETRSFQKLLTFCSDPTAIKKTLRLEVSLLGHEKLRAQMEGLLVERLITQVYRPMLEFNHVESGLSHEEVLERAQEGGINLNKFGRLSGDLKVSSCEAMAQILL